MSSGDANVFEGCLEASRCADAASLDSCGKVAAKVRGGGCVQTNTANTKDTALTPPMHSVVAQPASIRHPPHQASTHAKFLGLGVDLGLHQGREHPACGPTHIKRAPRQEGATRRRISPTPPPRCGTHAHGVSLTPCRAEGKQDAGRRAPRLDLHPHLGRCSSRSPLCPRSPGLAAAGAEAAQHQQGDGHSKSHLVPGGALGLGGAPRATRVQLGAHHFREAHDAVLACNVSGLVH
jgi:hypothetical protein